MGFFSSIKKFWNGDETEAPNTPLEPEHSESTKEKPASAQEPAVEESAALAEQAEEEQAAQEPKQEEREPEREAGQGLEAEEPEAAIEVLNAEPEGVAEKREQALAEEREPVEEPELEEAAEVPEPEPEHLSEKTEPEPEAPRQAAEMEEAAPALPPEADAVEVAEKSAPVGGQAAETLAAAEKPEEPLRAEAAAPKGSGGFFAGLKKFLTGDGSEEGKQAEPQKSAGGPSAGSAAAPLDDRLALALREAEPRLSVWLGIVLEGVEEAGPLLWERLGYLLRALETPEPEAAAFVDEFKTWLKRMDYVYVPEFRSELQYRLALALDLEDEEDERNRLLLKLSSGLARTREQISRGLDAVFSSHSVLNAAFWEELEEIFIMADMGPEAAMRLVKNLKERAQKEGVDSPEAVRGLLKDEMAVIFQNKKRISAINPPEVVLMVGVNGVGKTTTIAKLAHRARMQGRKVLIAAGDTFRAAAVEQMGIWAERVGAGFHCRDHGADPAAVAYEAMDIALRDGYDLLFVDTAGRLHTKINLMEELTKIRNVIGKKHPGAPHRTILVIDATTGQNALAQTKMFKEAAKVDEIILTKLDGTAKGGVAIAVAMQYDAPITFIGLGEKLEDLRPFNGEDFAAALLEGYGAPASKIPG